MKHNSTFLQKNSLFMPKNEVRVLSYGKKLLAPYLSSHLQHSELEKPVYHSLRKLDLEDVYKVYSIILN